MKRVSLTFFLLLVVLGLPFLGSEPIRLSEIFDPSSTSYLIFWDLRVPRWILTLAAGGLLSILGATYQGLFQNPLSEPYLFGISSAVTLGIVAAQMVFQVDTYSWVTLVSGLGLAILVTLLLAYFSNGRFGNQTDRIVLFGMGTNFFLSSVLFLLLSYQNQSVGGGAMRWLFGHIPWVPWPQAVGFLVFSLACLLGLVTFARVLDALQLGDVVAKTLGVSARRSRAIFLVVTSLMMSILVLMTGTVGFVGLIIPHVVRLLWNPQSTRALMVGSFFIGGCFLSASDVVSRIALPPFEFPVGVITTLLGGPVFLYFLWRRS